MARQARKPRSRRPVCRGWPNTTKEPLVSGDAVTAWKWAGANGPFKIGLGAERAGSTPDAKSHLRLCPTSHWLARDFRTSVVVGPFTTNAAPERTSRQAHVAQKSQRSQPGAWEAPDDHGDLAAGGWDARPENSSAIFP